LAQGICEAKDEVQTTGIEIDINDSQFSFIAIIREFGYRLDNVFGIVLFA
jgi:hypothetical protein